MIVFSERCELKKLNVGDNIVIKRPYLRNEINRDKFNEYYSKEEIDDFYNKLKPYTNVDEITKQKHIDQFS